MKRAIIGAALCSLAACATAQAGAWSLRGKDEPVAFHGLASYDRAGVGEGAMMYPAPNALGLLVAIATHGVLVESTKNSQKAKLQQEADKVLDPYRETLATLKQRDLLERALGTLRPDAGVRSVLPAGDVPAEGGWIDGQPVFWMTQDRRALVLDHAIALFSPSDPAKPLYETVVRVVSRPTGEDEAAQHWALDGAAALKTESAALLAESVRIALDDAARGSAPQDAAGQRTYRYPEGGTVKFERAQLVSQDCERRVLKTLRGTLLSVPLRAEEASACAETAAAARPAAQ